MGRGDDGPKEEGDEDGDGVGVTRHTAFLGLAWGDREEGEIPRLKLRNLMMSRSQSAGSLRRWREGGIDRWRGDAGEKRREDDFNFNLYAPVSRLPARARSVVYLFLHPHNLFPESHLVPVSLPHLIFA